MISRSSLRSQTSGLLGTYLHDTMPSQTFDREPEPGSVEAFPSNYRVGSLLHLTDLVRVVDRHNSENRHGVFICTMVVSIAGHHPH